ncbi:sodium:solute symporter family protein [Butyricicoccus faecihominis]|uniref:sodium:solute symporter family protein n=1 Tax=Butyricicoccaceae TaxID=3085642 RepID=UPI002478C7BA|nr:MULTISPECIES: sodium:solute symporter family protein [Butyricicoccaceae]MCQ5131401.1 sodium:solute symporter family protein [Butyricicoccus faecihominis]WNX84500.1 sodium:solute symporter family protein [Agathobaculum sp. NTUH-O15-33]
MRLAALDWVIVALFILGITAIGLMASKKAHGKKEELLVAGRNVGMYVMLASVVAGEWGAITMVYQAEAGYNNGLSAMFLGVVIVIGSVLAGMGGYFAVWVRRLKIMTIPEIMEFRYGKVARAIAGFAMVAAFLVMLGTFLQGLGNMFGVFLGTDPKLVMTLMLILALAYTVTGGMWSVVLTDLVQFLILGLVIPLCSVIAIVHVGGWDALYNGVYAALGEPGVNPVACYGMPTIWYQIIYFFIAMAVYPTSLTRVCSCRSVREGYKGSTLGYSSFLARACFPVIIGAAGLIIVPNLTSGITAYAETMLAIVPTGLLGLIVAGMLSAFMSTADTYYMTCASMIPQDIIGPLLPQNKKLSDKQTSLLIRLGILLTALCALYVGYYYEGGMIYWVVKLAELMFVSGVAVACFFGMYWKKANQWGACASLVFGLLSAVITNYILGLDAWVIGFSSMGSSVVGMVVFSLLTQKTDPPKKIVGVYRERRGLANGMD